MKSLTGNERYRCFPLSLGGYGRSQSTDIAVLELEEVDEAGGKTWRYATYDDLKPKDS